MRAAWWYVAEVGRSIAGIVYATAELVIGLFCDVALYVAARIRIFSERR